MLKVEAVKMPGTGKLELTGSLGDVMKESARTAYSYIRSISEALPLDMDFYKTLTFIFISPRELFLKTALLPE